MIQHFESLWEKSEDISTNLFKESSNNDLIKTISNFLEDYSKIQNLDISDEIKSDLKKRHLGEIVFLITCISKRDNVNVYAALQDELKMHST